MIPLMSRKLKILHCFNTRYQIWNSLETYFTDENRTLFVITLYTQSNPLLHYMYVIINLKSFEFRISIVACNIDSFYPMRTFTKLFKIN